VAFDYGLETVDWRLSAAGGRAGVDWLVVSFSARPDQLIRSPIEIKAF
jgi:hypothetical protein